MRYLPSAVLLLTVWLVGCGHVDRVVRVVATDDLTLVTNRVFVFYPSLELAPLVKSPPPVTATLNSNGEAHVRFPLARGWAKFYEGEKSYGTMLKPADISHGGKFRLYGAPPSVDDTNIYPSRYALEIQKP